MIETLTPPLRAAVSSYTGIVRALDECLCSTADARLYRATCEVAGDDGLLGSPLGHVSGIGGAGATRAEAARAAVGEALERYSASYVPRDELVVATARELGPAAVDPARFALFSPSQHAAPGFPFRPFTADTRVAWIEGRSVPGGERAWLPAELVFLGDAGIGEQPIGYATSSGAACGESRDEAIARGLCELLERDAFVLAWTASMELPLLDWSGDAAMCELDERFFAPTGLRYAVVDLSGFHALPSFLGVVRAPSGFPGALGVGAGTGATVERAWFKALAESFAARAAAQKLLLLDDRAYWDRGDGVVSFEDHIRYYGDARRAEAAAFLDRSTRCTFAEDVPRIGGDVVAALCARVEAAGSSVYVVDVTSLDVAQLGLVVTKVVAPELCALDVVHSARFLGGRRLREHIAEDRINPYPHPFP